MSINTAPAIESGNIINWNNQTYVVMTIESIEEGVTRFKCLNCTSAEEYTLINYSRMTSEWWDAIEGKAEFHYQTGLDCPDHYSREEELAHAMDSYPTYWREEGSFGKDLPDSLWYDEYGPRIVA